jgi:hypothetical protein
MSHLDRSRTVHAPHDRGNRPRGSNASTHYGKTAGQAVTGPFAPFTQPSVHARTPLYTGGAWSPGPLSGGSGSHAGTTGNHGTGGVS